MSFSGAATTDSVMSLGERCNNGNALGDENGDSFDDCVYAITERQVMGLLQERLPGTGTPGGVTIAAMSVHFPLNRHWCGAGGGNCSTALSAKERFAREVVTALRNRYQAANQYVLAGDFNLGRCAGQNEDIIPDVIDPENPASETVNCTPQTFWSALRSVGFNDVIYGAHSRSDETLRDQYRDGWVSPGVAGTAVEPVNNYRGRRIDYIFAAHGNVGRASHDLTCGIASGGGNRPFNCDSPAPGSGLVTNPEQYSDHRLMWAELNLPEPPAAAIEGELL